MKFKYLENLYNHVTGEVIQKKNEVIEIKPEHSQYMKEVLATGGVKYQILED